MILYDTIALQHYETIKLLHYDNLILKYYGIKYSYIITP